MNAGHWLLAFLFVAALAVVSLRDSGASVSGGQDLSATADAANALAGSARRAQTSTAEARSVAATAEMKRTRAAMDAISATETAVARETARAEAAYAFSMTATADALALAERQAQGTATADARALALALAVASATTTAHTNALEAERAVANTQIAIERERQLSSALYACIGSVAFAFVAAAALAGYWLMRAIDARYTVYRWAKVPPGAVLILGTSQTNWIARTAAPADIIPTRQLPADGGTVSVPAVKEDPDRALVVRLLRDSMQQYGIGSNRIITAQAPGWNSSDWQRAKALLGAHVASRLGRLGGTFVTSVDYPTLWALLEAVKSGAVGLVRAPPSPAASAPSGNTYSTPAQFTH